MIDFVASCLSGRRVEHSRHECCVHGKTKAGNMINGSDVSQNDFRVPSPFLLGLAASVCMLVRVRRARMLY